MPSKNGANYQIPQEKRFLPAKLYQLLTDYTDEIHHLKHNEIVKLLNEQYGIVVDRKAVLEKIKDINKFGMQYGIYVQTKNGTSLIDRKFNKSEISFLIDAVFSSRSIGQAQARELTMKLQSYLSKYERKSFDYVAKSSEMTRTDNKWVFDNIDILLEAIEKHKKIRFKYNRFYIDSLQNEKKKNRNLIASPYYLVNNQGKYYLVCNNNYFNDIANYRVERITDIEILDEEVKPLNSLDGCKNFDITKYANENIYMFSNDTVDAKVRIDSEYFVSYVQDWFGKNSDIFIDQNDNKIYAKIHSNEQALIYWCLQYGENIELLEPASTRKKIKEIVDKMKKNYK